MTQGMAGKPLLQGKGAGGAGRMAQQPGPAAGETGAALAAGREKGPMEGTEEARQAVFAANEMPGANPARAGAASTGPETSAANFGREAAHAQRVTGQPGFAKGEMGGVSRTRAGAASAGPGMSAANFGREAAHAQRVTGLPGFAKGEMPGVNPARAGAASAGPETSAANFGREAAHAQRVTGQPGFAKGEMGGVSRTRAGAANVSPKTSAANFGRKEDARQMARRTARAAMRIWAARTRRMREGWPGQEAVLCPECGRALAGGSPLYVRRGTGACLGCARDVDRHTPFLPVCPVCMGALGAGGPGEVPLYTAHGCDFVLGCGHCVAVREAGWPGQLEEGAGGC